MFFFFTCEESRKGLYRSIYLDKEDLIGLRRCCSVLFPYSHPNEGNKAHLMFIGTENEGGGPLTDDARLDR
jgi:hypothetical protein